MKQKSLKQTSQSSVVLAWFKTGNHTIVGPMLPTALCPLCVGVLGAYCLTVILRAYTMTYIKPKHGITGPYRSQVFFPFFSSLFSFSFPSPSSFLFPPFSLFCPLSSLWVTGPGRPGTKLPMGCGDRQNATTGSPPMEKKPYFCVLCHWKTPFLTQFVTERPLHLRCLVALVRHFHMWVPPGLFVILNEYTYVLCKHRYSLPFISQQLRSTIILAVRSKNSIRLMSKKVRTGCFEILILMTELSLFLFIYSFLNTRNVPRDGSVHGGQKCQRFSGSPCTF